MRKGNGEACRKGRREERRGKIKVKEEREDYKMGSKEEASRAEGRNVRRTE